MVEDSDEELEPLERMSGVEAAAPIANNRVNVAYPNGYEPAKRRFSVSSESFHPEILTQPSVIRALPKTDDVRIWDPFLAPHVPLHRSSLR